MPPTFPHAVYTPDNCLMVGGQLYVAGSIARSIEGLKQQETFPGISNEDLYDSTYHDLARILDESDAITSSSEKAQIATACSLFVSPAVSDYTKMPRANLVNLLKQQDIGRNNKATKQQLIELLVAERSESPRSKFLLAAYRYVNRTVYTASG